MRDADDDCDAKYFLGMTVVRVNQGVTGLVETSSHCRARRKSFSVIPASSCVVSVNVTLSNLMEHDSLTAFSTASRVSPVLCGIGRALSTLTVNMGFQGPSLIELTPSRRPASVSARIADGTDGGPGGRTTRSTDSRTDRMGSGRSSNTARFSAYDLTSSV